MTADWDLAVIGLGAVGAQSLENAGRRGIRVLGIEQYEAGHSRGASGGQSRIFRLAYKEGSEYLPLLRESYQQWNLLQSRTSQVFWEQTGAITIGRRNHPSVAALLRCIAEGGLDHSVLAADEARQRWPQHQMMPDEVVVHDPLGGLLRPEPAIRAAIASARRAGARVLTDAVRSIRLREGGYRIALHSGSEVRASRIVISCGAWAGDLVPRVRSLIELRRVVLQWYPTEDRALFGPDRFPVGLHYRDTGWDYSFFPQIDELGMKVNWYLPKMTVSHASAPVNPVPRRYCGETAPGIVRAFRGVRATPSTAAAFVESYTPTLRPVIRPVDQWPGSCVVTGLSGQGFKMSPALGRWAVDLALGETSASW